MTHLAQAGGDEWTGPWNDNDRLRWDTLDSAEKQRLLPEGNRQVITLKSHRPLPIAMVSPRTFPGTDPFVPPTLTLYAGWHLLDE